MTDVVTLPTLDVGQYDSYTDTIEIEGTRYAGELLRDAFGSKTIIGQVFRIEKHENGVLTVKRLPQFENAAEENTL